MDIMDIAINCLSQPNYYLGVGYGRYSSRDEFVTDIASYFKEIGASSEYKLNLINKTFRFNNGSRITMFDLSIDPNSNFYYEKFSELKFSDVIILSDYDISALGRVVFMNSIKK